MRRATGNGLWKLEKTLPVDWLGTLARHSYLFFIKTKSLLILYKSIFQLNMKIYDCFMFFDEEMLLDLRLNIMDKYVDKFVITEATYTHSGSPKKLIFCLVLVDISCAICILYKSQFTANQFLFLLL